MSGEASAAVVDRLRGRLAELEAIGADPEGGWSRLAYTEGERRAHDRFGEWVAAAGGRVEVDPFGNTIGVLGEGEPYLLLGSHLDSVRRGGAYDGTIGVVAGLEAGLRLCEDGPVRVVAFAAEEGARFGRPCIGSALAAGVGDAAELGALRDADGVRLEEAARELGFDLAGPPWVGTDEVLAFLELHIEQGRVLEDSGILLGAVDAVAGSIRLRVELSGLAEHSGATPMALRRDALAAAAAIVLAIEDLPREQPGLRATVGQLRVLQGGVTTVPGRVSLTVDLRETDPEQLREAAARTVTAIRGICEQRQIGLELRELSAVPPVLLSSWARLALQAAAAEHRIDYRIMPSGAGHDAALVAHAAAAAMLFVPCEGGRSHDPSESCRIDDVAVAAQVLADAGRRLFADARRGGQAAA